MVYEVKGATIDLEIERLRPERRQHGPRNTNNLIPAIKMVVGEWYVDELGVLTREIRAHD